MFSASLRRGSTVARIPSLASACLAALPYGAVSGLAIAIDANRLSASSSSFVGGATLPVLIHSTIGARAYITLVALSHLPAASTSSTNCSLADANTSIGAPSLTWRASMPLAPKSKFAVMPVAALKSSPTTANALARCAAAATRIVVTAAGGGVGVGVGGVAGV